MLDVIIGFPVNQTAHSLIGDIMHFGKLQNTHVEFGKLLAQRLGFFVGETCQAMCFAARSILAFLFKHICDVVLLCASKQVCRIHTGAIVASMAYKQIVRNRFYGQSIGDSMRANRDAPNGKLTVSIWEAGALPKPTIVWSRFRNFCPEPICERRKLLDVIMMIVKELIGFSVANHGLLTTATLAISVGDVVRGMIVHVASPFVTIGHAVGCLQQRRGASIVTSIVPYLPYSGKVERLITHGYQVLP